MKGRLNLAVTDLGPTHLKNIDEPIRVYSLEVGIPAQAKPVPAPVAEKSAPRHLSMVVLPFANMGGGTEHEHFVDGVTESLTTDLSRIRGAVVIGRNTAFTYKGRRATSPDFASSEKAAAIRPSSSSTGFVVNASLLRPTRRASSKRSGRSRDIRHRRRPDLRAPRPSPGSLHSSDDAAPQRR